MTSAVFQIDPKGVYDDDVLYVGLGVTARTLAKARCSGQLRFARKGNRILYLGEWLLDWLALDGPQERAISSRSPTGSTPGAPR